MIFTVSVDFPDQLSAEAIPLFAKEKSLDIDGKSAQEITEIVAQSIADEQVDRFKELIRRERVRQANEQFDQEIASE